ncbi:MAG: zinc ribbon domain-containing protein [Terrisporobacter sp.]|uniref:zinc ribbon domain-containing protein n=1 Tax=Terrisporobacter sp. TaxID=1965305 RepID=UPI002FC93D1C
MKDIKLSNIQKESERLKIKKNISELEDRKAQILLEIGMMTFHKIRKNEIEDDDFNHMCEDIKNLDISIYSDFMRLKNLEKHNDRITCECGYLAYKNEKFCPQCGNNLVTEEDAYIICNSCNEKNDIESNYCGCCGNKIKTEEIDKLSNTIEDMNNEDVVDEEILYNDYEEYEYSEEEEDYIYKEEPIEEEGRVFLKNQENN